MKAEESEEGARAWRNFCQWLEGQARDYESGPVIPSREVMNYWLPEIKNRPAVAAYFRQAWADWEPPPPPRKGG